MEPTIKSNKSLSANYIKMDSLKISTSPLFSVKISLYLDAKFGVVTIKIFRANIINLARTSTAVKGYIAHVVLYI